MKDHKILFEWCFGMKNHKFFTNTKLMLDFEKLPISWERERERGVVLFDYLTLQHEPYFYCKHKKQIENLKFLLIFMNFRLRLSIIRITVLLLRQTFQSFSKAFVFESFEISLLVLTSDD